MHKTLKVDTSKKANPDTGNSEQFLGFGLGKQNIVLPRMCLSPSLTVSQMSSDLMPKKSPLDRSKLVKMSTFHIPSEKGYEPMTAKGGNAFQKSNTYLDAFSY
jgi:hypothetical protein